MNGTSIVYKTRKQAKKLMPEASWLVKVDGGYRGFEYYDEYLAFCEYKYQHRKIITSPEILRAQLLSKEKADIHSEASIDFFKSDAALHAARSSREKYEITRETFDKIASEYYIKQAHFSICYKAAVDAARYATAVYAGYGNYSEYVEDVLMPKKEI